VIRIERVSMPDGLRAIGHRDPQGDLIIYISDALDMEGARAAVQEVIRASRRAGWRTGLPPVGVALLVALGQLLRGGATALRAQRAAWAAAATALAAGGGTAAIFLMPVPHQHVSAAPVRPPVRSTASPHQPRSAPARHRRQPAAATPSAPARVPARPKPARTPTRPVRPSPVPSRSPTPAPSPLPPSPSPSPSPTVGDPGGCVTVLVIRACVPPISL